MGKYDNLLDSIRFNACADDFARAWKKRGITREEKLMRLEAFLEAVGGLSAGSQIPQAKIEITQQHDIPRDDGVIKSSPQDQAAGFNDRLNATLELIRDQYSKATIGGTFTVMFPSDGQYEIQAVDSLIQSVGLACQATENRGAKRIGENVYMAVEFVRVG